MTIFVFSGENYIKNINGKLFEPLKKLTGVSLYGNTCIDEGAYNQSQVVALRQKMNEKCGFDEPVIVEITTKHPTSINAKLEAELNALKHQLNETEAILREKIQELQLQLQTAQNENFKANKTAVDLEICEQKVKTCEKAFTEISNEILAKFQQFMRAISESGIIAATTEQTTAADEGRNLAPKSQSSPTQVHVHIHA